MCRIKIFNNLISIFKKQGGFELIKRYFFGGALFTAVFQFILLGKSQTALEILRLSTDLKIKKKLKKEYSWKLYDFEINYVEEEQKKSDIIWICWFQGIDSMPSLVQKCFESVHKYNSDKQIILITRDNIFDFVEFPDYIIEKWNNGEITDTHFSDLLRLELLVKYGGLWLDATVFCSDEIPEFIWNSNLFFYQNLKPGKDGHSKFISSWLIHSTSNNKILIETRELCYEYWKHNNYLIDYFLLHDFLSIVLEQNAKEWHSVIPFDNSTPHILLLNFFEKYSFEAWNVIKSQTPIHKLTYKLDQREVNKKNTYYQKFMRGDL